MTQPRSKMLLLGFLVACFAGQSFLVYSDEPAVSLSADAVRGRELYHQSRCQVCHQLFGFGGFLGPDLTNVVERVDDVRFSSMLTVGGGQMPGYGFSVSQISELKTYLTELHRPDLGRGQLRLGDPTQLKTPQQLLETAVATLDPPETVIRGFDLFSQRSCSSCHAPLRVSPVGAPDLSTTLSRNTEPEMRAILTDGRPARGMPRPNPALSDLERDDLIAWLRWLNANRASVESEFNRSPTSTPVDWSRLPWWEY